LISLIAQVVGKVITILTYAIVIRAFISFLPQLKSNKLTMLLYDVTDPLLKPFQRFQIGGAAMPFDFSPLLAIIALNLIGWLSKWLLYFFF
jgi:YggT family protein